MAERNRLSAAAESSADAAVAELYAAHWAGLVRLAWLLLHDDQGAEEVVQDAFIAVHRRWGSLRSTDRAAAYLRRSVVNGARSALMAANWNKSQAAQQLHWSRMTLYRKMSRYQVFNTSSLRTSGLRTSGK